MTRHSKRLLLLGLSLILLDIGYLPVEGLQKKRLWTAIYRGDPVWLKVPIESDERLQQSEKPTLSGSEKGARRKGDDGYELHFVLPSWYSAHFIDNRRGWIAGSAGTRGSSFPISGGALIAFTPDGGQSWSTQKMLDYGYLRSVFFIDPLNGWVAGTDIHKDKAMGIVANTSDGGRSWISRFTLDNYELSALHDIQFVDSSAGWAVGEAQVNGDVQGLIIATRDGGRTWSQQYLTDRTYVLERVKFVDRKKGWAVGARVILHTEDGGQSWNEQRFEGGEELFDITLLNSNELWAVGADGLMLHTLDRGRVWRKRYLPSKYKSSWLSCVYFKNSLRGWVAGNEGIILTTENGGRSWHLESRGRSSYLRSFTATNGKLIVAGNDGIVLERKIE